MAGDEVDLDDWKGALDVTYKYGPGFVNPDRYVITKFRLSHSVADRRGAGAGCAAP